MNRHNCCISLLTSVLLCCCFLANAAADDFGIKPRNRISSPFFSAGAAQRETAKNVPNNTANTAADNDIASGELPNVVRIVSYDKAGQSLGSGSYIGSYNNYGLILSNHHIVEESDCLIHVHFPNGFSSFGFVLLSDDKWDLALILISRPPNVPPLPIARRVPEIGESLWIAGFGSNEYRIAKGNCVRYMAPEIPKDGSAPIYEILDLSVTARQGDSGGPILNKNGELAGVLFGSDMIRNTAGSHCIRVSKFLVPANEKLEKIPFQPELLFATVEPDGPKHSLRESKNVVPAKLASSEPISRNPELQRRNSTLDNTGSGFGVRQPSKRYTQPSPAVPSAIYADPYSTPAAPTEKQQQKSTSENPQSSSTVHPAIWNQPFKKTTGGNSPNSGIVQTNHGTPKNTAAAVPSPFDNDLSALNPSPNRSRIDTELDSKLPRLSGTRQMAAHNEAVAASVPQLVPMTNLSESEVRQIGQSIPLTPASTTHAAPSFIWISCTAIAVMLAFTGIRLLRYDTYVLKFFP